MFATARWLLVSAVAGAVCGCVDVAAPSNQAIDGRTASLAAAEVNSIAEDDTINERATFLVEDLGVLRGDRDSYASGINAAGHIVGTSVSGMPTYHAVIWVGSSAIELQNPNIGLPIFGVDVNDQDTVIGYGGNSPVVDGVIWPMAGAPVVIPRPVGTRALIFAGINNHDEAVGYTEMIPSGFHAIRYTPAGGVVDIHPAGYLSSYAYAVSDDGTIVGAVQLANFNLHAARWATDGTFTDLGTLGGTTSVATGVNLSGAIVGSASGAFGIFQPFVWRQRTGMVGGGFPGGAVAISDHNRMIGIDQRGADNRGRTQKGHVFSILPVPPGTPSWVTNDINTCGTIAGYALLASNVHHALRWTINKCD